MSKKITAALLVMITMLFISGCESFQLHKEEWDKLENRKFYFTEFTYLYTGSTADKTYNEMKDFPLKKIMYILSRNYNIEIDMSDYNTFIVNRNLSEIKASGIFQKNRFTWNSKNKDASNSISIILEKDYMDETKMNFKLKVSSGGNRLQVMDINFSTTKALFGQIGYYIKKSDEHAAEYDKNSYEDKNPVPGLYLVDPTMNNPGKISRTADIKMILEDYVKTLDPEQKKSFKHEMIDHIYKICE